MWELSAVNMHARCILTGVTECLSEWQAYTSFATNGEDRVQVIQTFNLALRKLYSCRAITSELRALLLYTLRQGGVRGIGAESVSLYAFMYRRNTCISIHWLVCERGPLTLRVQGNPDRL